MIESTFAVIFLVLLFLLYHVILLWKTNKAIWTNLSRIVDYLEKINKYTV